MFWIYIRREPPQFGQPGTSIVFFEYDGDGVIDVADSAFSSLRIWRDLNGNGVADAGELQTMGEAGLASLSLTRNDVTGTNEGHQRGFSGVVTRTDGTTTTAKTIYFQTDRRIVKLANDNSALLHWKMSAA